MMPTKTIKSLISCPQDELIEHYDRLISSVYHGVLEETPWQSFLPLLQQILDVKVVSLVLRPPAADNQGLILNYLRPDKQLDEASEPDENKHIPLKLASPNDWPSLAYKEQFFSLDPFVNLTDGVVVSLAELIPEQDLLASEYYQNYLKPAGVFHILGADTKAEDGTLARIRLSRGPDEKGFCEAERKVFERLLPHLQRAILLHARLNRVESERALFADAMDKLSVGTILLDEHANVLSTNAVAEHLVAQKDGISLIENKLTFQGTQDSLQIQSIITEVLDAHLNKQAGMVKACRLTRPSGRADLGIVVRAVPTSAWSEGQSSPAIALFISDPEQQFCTSQNTLVELFNLSPAEAALALLLTRGLTLADASDELNISQHTARAQLKSIFLKSGVTRQAELIRLIVKSVADLA
jgi:DNA-binding CsgD family transcriptional regulator